MIPIAFAVVGPPVGGLGWTASLALSHALFSGAGAWRWNGDDLFSVVLVLSWPLGGVQMLLTGLTAAMVYRWPADWRTGAVLLGAVCTFLVFVAIPSGCVDCVGLSYEFGLAFFVAHVTGGLVALRICLWVRPPPIHPFP